MDIRKYGHTKYKYICICIHIYIYIYSCIDNIWCDVLVYWDFDLWRVFPFTRFTCFFAFDFRFSAGHVALMAQRGVSGGADCAALRCFAVAVAARRQWERCRAIWLLLLCLAFLMNFIKRDSSSAQRSIARYARCIDWRGQSERRSSSPQQQQFLKLRRNSILFDMSPPPCASRQFIIETWVTVWSA